METLEGIINIRKQFDSLWSICSIGGKNVVGILTPEIKHGSYVKVSGKSIEHNTYGEQFQINSIQMTLPADETGIAKYLESNIKWIGKAISKKLIDVFGKNIFDVIENDPEQLVEQIASITSKRATQIQDTWFKTKDSYEIDLFFNNCDISSNLIYKIYELYLDGNVNEDKIKNTSLAKRKEIVQEIKHNPYKLTEIKGIGFKKADSIATKLGTSLDSQSRIRAAIIYALEESANDGDCFMALPHLYQESNKLLMLDSILKVPKEIESMVEDGELIQIRDDIDKIYLEKYNYFEQEVANRISDLSSVERAGIISKDLLENLSNWNDLTDRQKQAIKIICKHNLLIITGGPGVGKTYLINTIKELLLSQGETICMAAPTGKAAKRIKEQTGFEATTIHRLLQFNPALGWAFNSRNPLEEQNVIIDESSMIDIGLMYRLTNAIDYRKTRLILVGDIDQLPSVGAGQVFRDIIKSKSAPIVVLNEIKRQKGDETYPIIKNAHNINMGLQLEIDNEKSFFVKYLHDSIKIQNETLKSILWLTKEQGLGLSQIQVLCPMKKTNIGTIEMNKVISNVFNTAILNDKNEDLKIIKGTSLRLGDRVIHTKNNYDKECYKEVENFTTHDKKKCEKSPDGFFGEIPVTKGLVPSLGRFNGDSGTIVGKSKNFVYVKFDDGCCAYKIKEAQKLLPAWAMTIHKSQGSEYEAVILPLHTNMYVMLQRNLLYTAVTRAKRYVILIAHPSAVNTAISTIKSKNRNTGLAERIQQLSKGT